MKTLEEEWKQYRDACYPPAEGKLPPLQESETRQAFFAGCLTGLVAVTNSAEGLSEDQAYKQIMGLLDEARAVCSERIYEMKGRN